MYLKIHKVIFKTFGVEIDLKMPGGQNLPAEIGILDLIFTKIVLPRGRAGEPEEKDNQKIYSFHFMIIINRDPKINSAESEVDIQ